jgi:membrane-associated phospholipid phosphatase
MIEKLICMVLLIVCNDPSVAQGSTDMKPPLQDSVHGHFRAATLILPGTMLAYGCLKPAIPAIRKLDDRIWNATQDPSGWYGSGLDTYLQWAPSVSIYVLDAFKVRTRHSFRQHLLIDAGSVLMTGGGGFILRKVSERMDGFELKGTQFPSGHTANAFRGAEILRQELKHTHPVWSFSGYLVAGAVGFMRIQGRQHQLSEVIAGAGLGMLSTKLTYWALGRIMRRDASFRHGF